jgi:hypothetical protein
MDVASKAVGRVWRKVILAAAKEGMRISNQLLQLDPSTLAFSSSREDLG